MSITILALAATLRLSEIKPEMVKPFDTMDACVAEANKRNATDEDLKAPEMRASGLAYVCMPIVFPL